MHRFARGIGAGAGDDFDFAGGKLDGEGDDVEVLFVVDRGRFASGANGHDAIHARLNLNFNQAFERGFVNFAVFKRRHNCSIGSSKHLIFLGGAFTNAPNRPIQS